MATDIETLVVALEARTKAFENALVRSNNLAAKNAKAIETRFATMNKNLGDSFGSFAAKGIAAFAALASVDKLKDLADSATNIQNSLKVAGLSGDALTDTFNKLYDVAQKNHAPIESLVELYSRASINQQALGASSEQLIQFTDNVGKALRVSGTSATEAAGPLLQLSQALGSGTVHAEEFNSIVEGMPALAIAAAKGIKQANGSVAELKNLVNNQQLSSRALFDGIAAGASDLDDKVSGASTTIGQSLTDLYNAMTRAVGKFDESTGAAKKTVDVIEEAVAVLNNADFSGLINQINQVESALKVAAGGAQDLWTAIQNFSNGINGGKPLIDLGPGNALTDPLKGRTFDQAAALKDSANLQEDADAKHLAALQEQYRQQKQIGALLPGGGNNRDEQAASDADVLNQMDAIRDKASKSKDAVVALDDATAKLLAKNNLPVQGPVDPRTIQGPRLPPKAPINPIDITDDKYKPVGTKKGTGRQRGPKQNDYQRETKDIQAHTDALNAETDAQSKLNPLVNDYGYAVDLAKTKQELLTAAKKADVDVTPEVEDNINKLAEGYANASVAAEKLAATQDKVRERADFLEGAVSDAFTSLIPKINTGNDALDKFLDTMIEAVEQAALLGKGPFASATANGGLLSFIPKIFGFADGGIAAHGRPMKRFAGGGISRSASIFGEAGPEAAVPLPDGRRIPVDLRLPERAGSAGSSYAPVYNIDARGADQAAVDRLQRGLAERDRTESKRVAGYNRTAQVRKVRP